MQRSQIIPLEFVASDDEEDALTKSARKCLQLLRQGFVPRSLLFASLNSLLSRQVLEHLLSIPCAKSTVAEVQKAVNIPPFHYYVAVNMLAAHRLVILTPRIDSVSLHKKSCEIRCCCVPFDNDDNNNNPCLYLEREDTRRATEARMFQRRLFQRTILGVAETISVPRLRAALLLPTWFWWLRMLQHKDSNHFYPYLSRNLQQSGMLPIVQHQVLKELARTKLATTYKYNKQYRTVRGSIDKTHARVPQETLQYVREMKSKSPGLGAFGVAGMCDVIGVSHTYDTPGLIANNNAIAT